MKKIYNTFSGRIQRCLALLVLCLIFGYTAAQQVLVYGGSLPSNVNQIANYYIGVLGAGNVTNTGGTMPTAAQINAADLIILALPNVNYPAAVTAAVQNQVLTNGKRLLLMGEWGGFASTQNGRQNGLLSALGATTQIQNASISLGCDPPVVPPALTIAAHPLVAGYTQIQVAAASRIINAPTPLLTFGTDVLYSVESVGSGDVVVSSDLATLIITGCGAMNYGEVTNLYDNLIGGCNTPPAITCGPDIIGFNAPGQCGTTINFPTPNVSGGCGNVTVICNPPSGSFFDVGVTVVECIATDPASGSDTCYFSITINDTEPPSFAEKLISTADLGTEYADGWQGGDNDPGGFGGPWIFFNSTPDLNFAGQFICSSTINGDGDDNGDGDIDTGPPITPTCQGSAWGLYANSGESAAVFRNLGGALVPGAYLSAKLDHGFAGPPTPGITNDAHMQLWGAGMIMLSINGQGNASGFYEIVDQTGGNLTPVPVTDEGVQVEIVALSLTSLSITMTPINPVDGPPFNFVATTFNPGPATQIRFTNHNYGAFSPADFFINELVLCLPTCLDDIVVDNDPGECGAVVNYNTPIAYDNCPGVTVTCIPPSGSFFDVGTTTVTCIATDAAGLTDTCSFNITVNDVEAPVLTCPADTVVGTDPGLCEAEVEVIVDVTDNCSSFTLDTAQSPVTAYTVVPGGAGNTILNIPVALAAAVNGTLVIRHRGDINSSFERFTVQGEDGSNLGQTNNGSQCGGYATTTFALTGAQIAAWGADGTVSITLLQNTSIDLFCTNNDAFALLYYTSSDIVVTNSYTANGADASGIYPVGTTTVTFTATDASGNTASCSVDITVEDTEAPEALCLGGVGGGTPLVAYLTMQSNPPWCEPFCGTGGDNPALLDDVFGAGNWDSYDFGTVNVATLFSANYNTIIMDGSDGAANAMETFLTANQAAMENWVAAGNVLFLNSAPNQGNGMSFGFGGVQLTYPSFNGNANAVLAAHPIFNGPATPVGLSWTGNFFGHAIVCPAALTATVLIEGAGGNDLLVDANWGSGKVLFGGMTLPHFHNPKPHTLNLRRNIFSYMAASIISGPLEFELDANGELLLTPADIDNGSSDNCGIESMTVIPDMFDCDDIGSHVVELIVIDSAGNADTCSAQIEIADELGPVITCPADVTIECDEDQTPASLGTATATDNCSDPADIFITFNDAITPGNCPGNYTIHRTWTAIDEAGNWSTCVQTITVEDTQAPVPPAAPADVTVECMADVPAPAFLMAQDNCEGMIVGVSADSITPGLCPNEKTITRTWLFKDGCNNSVTVSQTIVVDDNTAPDAPDLPDLSFQCADDVPAPPAVVTALDNCDGVIVGVFNEVTTPGSCVNNFVVTRTWIFVDACGNQSSEVQTITVNDDTDPVASCPPDVSGLQCGDTPPAAATTIADFLALGGTVSDNCTATGDLTISSSDSDNGNTECVSDGIRVITRTYTFTDECGNSTSCDQTFTYDEDTSAPDITCPADESDLDCNYVVPAGATDIASFLALGGTASDNCTATADLSVSYVDNDNMTLSCPGDARVIVRTYTITDACGNSATCDQTFTYEEITTPPVINCPPDLVCLCGNPNNPLLISNWLSSVTASSDCPLSVSITNDYPNGIFTPDCGNAGTQEVTFTATDQCGNVSECTATITFVDNNPPELDCPAPLTVGTDGGLGAGGFCQDNPDPVVAVIGTYLFADDVANDLIAAGYNATHYSSVPSAATLAGIDVVMLIRAFGNTDLENWVQAGGLLVTEWTATDWAINTAGLLQGNVFHVGFLGTGTPVKFEATPEGMALGAGMDNPYSDTERTQFFRGFSGLGAGTSVIATRPGNQPAIVGGESGSGYVLAIGYCWSDRFNSQPNAQTDLLMDNAIAYCLGTDGCVATIGPGVVAIDAFDKCDPNFTVTNDSPHADDNNSADAAGVYPKGVYDITFTATDACGNVSSCVVSLTVEDDDPAVISCPDDIVVDADPGECGAIVSFNLPEFADNCPDPILTQVSGLGSGDFFPTGTTVQEYMVIDCGGNVSMCSFSVTVNNTLKSKCTTYSYAPGTPSDHALLLNNLPFGLNSRFLWVGGQGTLDVFLDGTARLSGQVVNVSDANAIFDVDMNFENEMSWAMWSALGRNYKANAVNQAVADANHMDWTFWELGTATITGAAGSTYDGDVISMTHKPADYSYGFQLGLGANDKDTDYGFSGWFYYSGTLGGQNASGDGDVNNDASCQENPCGVSIAVAPRMMLEGPFNAATMKMNDDLRVAGYIPLSEPYTSYGFPHAGNGGGESMDQTVLQQTGDDAIVDWVVVSLRNINDIETILATKSALLQADGDIVDVDGVSPVSFEGVAAGQYHVGIHHENHLWVVSNYTYNLSASAEYLDFSDGSVLAFGEDGMEELAGLIKAMTAFDLNGDGAITAIDRSLAWNKRNQVGDHREDGDLDGSVNAADRSGVWNNRNKLTEDPAQF